MGGLFFTCTFAAAAAVLGAVCDWLGDWIEILQNK